MIKSTIYFNQEIVCLDGLTDELTTDSWLRFLEGVVDKYYEDYSWYEANRPGRRNTGVFVLEIIHEKAEGEAASVASIIEVWKELYRQEAVTVITSPVMMVLI
jgi:hypothetical protein